MLFNLHIIKVKSSVVKFIDSVREDVESVKGNNLHKASSIKL